MKNLLILLLLIFFSCQNSKKAEKINVENKVNDSEIYEIVNLVILEDNQDLKYAGIKEDLSPSLLDRFYYEEVFNKIDSTKLDSIFSKADLKFISQQIKDRKGFKFNQRFISSKKIISADTIQAMLERTALTKNPHREFDKVYNDRFGKGDYLIIGLPVFSIDKKTAFISFISGGRSMIYKKINNKWKFYRCSSYWT